LHYNNKTQLLYVAQVHSNFPSKWANNFQVIKMCSAFSGNNIETTLLAPLNNKTKYNLEKIKPDIWDFYGVKNKFKIKWIKFHYPNLRFKHLFHGIMASIFIARNNYNLVYTRSEWVAILSSFFLKKKVLLELHNFQNSFSQKVLTKISPLNKSLYLVCISEALKSELIINGYKNNILVGHDGVDLNLFNIKVNKKSIHLKYDLNTNKPIVTHIGSIRYGRGFNTIIDTAKKMTNIEFVFVCGHDADFEIIEKVKTQKIPNVKMLDFLPNSEIPNILKSSDILLMAYTKKLNTLQFTSPLKMFEYMASNVPIISSDIPVLREVLNENNALLIPPSDPVALQNGINMLLTTKESANALARQAYKDVKGYSWRKRAKKVINFVENYI